MRTIAVLLLSVAVFACHKNKKEAVTIIGTWELRKTDRDIAGIVMHPAGNGQHLVFRANGTFEKRYNGTVYETGTYKLRRTAQPGKWELETTVMGMTMSEDVRISWHELVFRRVADCCDFIDNYYERI